MDQEQLAKVELALAPDSQQVERRSAVRFPIEQEVRYRVFSRITAEAGAGRTLNISSAGVLFTTEHPLSPGDRLELSINWPAQLDHKCPLKLVTAGRVVRVDNGNAAIVIDRYEFRTQGLNGFA
jgi:c-di-GMP-binding flagellar brake protein YcgR